MNIQEIIKRPFPFRSKHWGKNMIAFMDSQKVIKFAKVGSSMSILAMNEANITSETYESIIGLQQNVGANSTCNLMKVLTDPDVKAGKKLFRSQAWPDNRLAEVEAGSVNLRVCTLGDGWTSLYLTLNDLQANDYLIFDLQEDTTKPA